MGASLKEKEEAGEIVGEQKTACGRPGRRKLFLLNNRTCISFAALLVLVHAALFCERIYSYRQSCAWVIVARASGQCLHFDCSLVLLLTLRKSVTCLRWAKCDTFLPLDRHIYFHKIIGWTICVFSTVHTLAHVANFAYLGKLTGISLYRYLFDVSLEIGWVAGLANPSGFAILALLLIIAVFSHRVVRKSGHFEVFYWTHLSCIPFYVLLVIHAPNVWKWITAPICVFVIEIVFRLIRIYSGSGKTTIVAVAVLPNQVVRLKIERPDQFTFKCGDYIYVNVPSIAKHEWHPFTISSAPENDYLTLHIRVAGGWTSRLHQVFSQELSLKRGQLRATCAEKACDLEFRSLPWQFQRDNLAFQTDFVSLQISPEVKGNVNPNDENIPPNELHSLAIPLYVDGPYGGPSTSIWRNKRVLLIAGGIGVTPFASLLQSLIHRYKSSMSACRNCGHLGCSTMPSNVKKLKHVDFVWVNRDLLSFQWFLELLLELDREQTIPGSVMEKFLNIQLYQTGVTHACELCSSRPAITDNPVSIVSNENCQCRLLSNKIQHLVRRGRPVWEEVRHFHCYFYEPNPVFQKVAVRNNGAVTVFYCGPPALGHVIEGKCREFGFAFRKEMF